MNSTIAKKLFLKEEHSVLLVNLPSDLSKLLSHPQAAYNIHDHTFDAVFLCITEENELHSKLISSFKARKEGGKFWLLYPKKSGSVTTTLNRDTIWKSLTEYSLQPNRMVSIDKNWSAIGVIHSSEQKKPSTFGQDPPGVDRTTKTVIPPDDLKALFNEYPKAKSFFESLAFSHKREYVGWIHSAKKEETRQRRLSKTIELLLDEKKVK